MLIKGEKNIKHSFKAPSPQLTVILSYGQSFHDLRHLYSYIQARESKLPNSSFKQLT